MIRYNENQIFRNLFPWNRPHQEVKMKEKQFSSRNRKNNSPFLWNYPLNRIQTGTALGNSLLGLLVWGADRTLHITIG